MEVSLEKCAMSDQKKGHKLIRGEKKRGQDNRPQRFVASDILQMKRWGLVIAPPFFTHTHTHTYRWAGLQGCTHLEQGWQGRQRRPGPGGELQPTPSTPLVNLVGGVREERPAQTHRKGSRKGGKPLFWFEWYFSKPKTNYFSSPFIPSCYFSLIVAVVRIKGRWKPATSWISMPRLCLELVTAWRVKAA